MAVAAGYALIGFVTAAASRPTAVAGHPVSRVAAWALSLVVFAWHIRYERLRPQARAGAARHVAAAVMLATAVLALLAIAHNLGAGPLRPAMLAAFAVWPALTGIGSFVVAFVALAVLPPRAVSDHDSERDATHSSG